MKASQIEIREEKKKKWEENREETEEHKTDKGLTPLADMQRFD